jgi:hypothetical protein
MKKIKISSADLAWIFRERLMTFADCSIGVAVAIVPDANFGWTAVFPKLKRHARRRHLPQERIDRIQRELRRLYQLDVD